MTAKKKTNAKAKGKTKAQNTNKTIEIPLYCNNQTSMYDFLGICEQFDKIKGISFSVSLADTYYDPVGNIQGGTFLFSIDTNGKDISPALDKIGESCEFGQVGIDRDYESEE